MTFEDFAKLKEGDRITQGVTGSKGEVSRLVRNGVCIVWGPRHAAEREITYEALSTAYFQWSKVEETDAAERAG